MHTSYAEWEPGTVLMKGVVVRNDADKRFVIVKANGKTHQGLYRDSSRLPHSHWCLLTPVTRVTFRVDKGLNGRTRAMDIRVDERDSYEVTVRERSVIAEFNSAKHHGILRRECGCSLFVGAWEFPKNDGIHLNQVVEHDTVYEFNKHKHRAGAVVLEPKTTFTPVYRKWNQSEVYDAAIDGTESKEGIDAAKAVGE